MLLPLPLSLNLHFLIFGFSFKILSFGSQSGIFPILPPPVLPREVPPKASPSPLYARHSNFVSLRPWSSSASGQNRRKRWRTFPSSLAAAQLGSAAPGTPVSEGRPSLVSSNGICRIVYFSAENFWKNSVFAVVNSKMLPLNRYPRSPYLRHCFPAMRIKLLHSARDDFDVVTGVRMCCAN